MIPYREPRAPHQNDPLPGVKDGTAKSRAALRDESGKERQTRASGNAYDVDALADHFGTLMKSDVPPRLEVLLRPLPPDLIRSLYVSHKIEGILPILSDNHAVQLRGFVLDYLTGLLCLEMDLVELLEKQDALQYFVATYAALVQDRAGRHGLRITKPLFDGRAGAGEGVAAMQRQWAAAAETEEGLVTTGCAAGGSNEKGRLLRLPSAPADTPPPPPTPTPTSPVPFLALELLDVVCRVADEVREDCLSRPPRLRATGGLATLLSLMDDVRFAHAMLMTSSSSPSTAAAVVVPGPEDTVVVARRLERVKHWQRTWVDEHLAAGAGGDMEGPAYSTMEKCCLVVGLLLLGLVLWMCVEVGVVETRPDEFGAGL